MVLTRDILQAATCFLVSLWHFMSCCGIMLCCAVCCRHRVSSQRMGWLLDRLADTLQDNVSALAPGPEVSHDCCEAFCTSLLSG